MDDDVCRTGGMVVVASSGYAEAIGHHGELVQGLFEDEHARLRRALVSLPCHHLKSKVTFSATEDGLIHVVPASRDKARKAAELTLAALGLTEAGGKLTIDSNIPIGRGMGSSTADVVASILAVLDWASVEARHDKVMQIAVSAETACDSTLFKQQAVLFAHREGLVLEAFSRPMPVIDLISLDTAPGETVDTLELAPARYNQLEIETFRPIRALLRAAIETADAKLLGRAATASTHVNERFLPKPRLKEIEALGARSGAIGVQVAHSGTLVGLMFDSADGETAHNIARAAEALRRSDFQPTIIRH